jgi:hypothetical protein
VGPKGTQAGDITTVKVDIEPVFLYNRYNLEKS